jgi:hypothetical protein
MCRAGLVALAAVGLVIVRTPALQTLASSDGVASGEMIAGLPAVAFRGAWRDIGRFLDARHGSAPPLQGVATRDAEPATDPAPATEPGPMKPRQSTTLRTGSLDAPREAGPRVQHGDAHPKVLADTLPAAVVPIEIESPPLQLEPSGQTEQPVGAMSEAGPAPSERVADAPGGSGELDRPPPHSAALPEAPIEAVGGDPTAYTQPTPVLTGSIPEVGEPRAAGPPDVLEIGATPVGAAMVAPSATAMPPAGDDSIPRKEAVPDERARERKEVVKDGQQKEESLPTRSSRNRREVKAEPAARPKSTKGDKARRKAATAAAKTGSPQGTPSSSQGGSPGLQPASGRSGFIGFERNSP